MRTSANSARTRLVPAMRYRDVAAAVDWLSAAFGFEKHRIVTGDDGAILYGLLMFGDHLIMVSPVRETDLDRLMKQPDEIGGAETQTCYLVVEDADLHYAKATAAGANIVIPIQDHDDLGRGFSCRDPEGHIWHFGTYDPWRGKPTGLRFPMGRDLRSLMLVGGMILAMVGLVGAGWMLEHAAPDELESGRTTEAIAAASRRADELGGRLELLTAQLTQARIAKDVAERAAQATLGQLERERTAKEVAERGVQRLGEQLAQERSAKDAADRTSMEATQHAVEEAKLELRHEREARQRVERTLQDMLSQLAFENDAKEAAERALREAKERLAERGGQDSDIADGPTQENRPQETPKEVVARRSPAGKDVSQAARVRVCGNILSDPGGYDQALVQLCLKASPR